MSENLEKSEKGISAKEVLKDLKNETKVLFHEVKESLETKGGIFGKKIKEIERKLVNPEEGIVFESETNDGRKAEYHLYCEKDFTGRINSLVIESKIDGHVSTGLWRLREGYGGSISLESGWEPDCTKVPIKTKEQLEKALMVFNDRLSDGLGKVTHGTIDKEISNSTYFAQNENNTKNDDSDTKLA